MRYIAALIERLLIKCVRIHELVDLDGNIYTTVIIGSQEWIVENLRVTQYADGTIIPHLTATDDWIADITGAYCWYNNDIGHKTPYGALYNWYTVNNAHGLAYLKRSGVQEAGWRIPDYNDINDLGIFLGGTAAAALKEVGLIHWNAPNTDATNSTGFTAIGSGYRHSDGNFYNFHEICKWWASDNLGGASAYRASVTYLDPGVYQITDRAREYGMSIRLVRDI